MRVDPGHDQGMHRSAHGRCTRSGAPPTTATFMQPLLSCFQLPNATQLSTPNRHTPHTVYPQQISTLTPSPAALRPKPHGTYLRLPPARAAAGHRAHPRTPTLSHTPTALRIVSVAYTPSAVPKNPRRCTCMFNLPDQPRSKATHTPLVATAHASQVGTKPREPPLTVHTAPRPPQPP